MSKGSRKFWRVNVRPGTTFGECSRTPTLWQRFYDWAFAPLPTNIAPPDQECWSTAGPIGCCRVRCQLGKRCVAAQERTQATDCGEPTKPEGAKP